MGVLEGRCGRSGRFFARNLPVRALTCGSNSDRLTKNFARFWKWSKMKATGGTPRGVGG